MTTRVRKRPAALRRRRADDAVVDRAAVKAALDPIVTIDASGVVRSASDSVERVFGWTPAELVGRNVNELMPEPHRSAHAGYLERYQARGTTKILNRSRRFDAQHRNGRVFPIEISVSRAEVVGRRSPLFVGILRDLSGQVAAERRRESDRLHLQHMITQQTAAIDAAHLRLRMADRMASIGTLAAGLGHDMGNVLLPVRAHLNSLREAILPDGAREHIDAIRRSIAYLQQLADGLHYLAVDPEREDVEGATELSSWWAKAGALISKAVPRHVKVNASMPAGLPAVGVAPHPLTQAVLNLVVNAGESIPAGRKRRQGRVRVWAESADRGSRVRIGVTDNGSGMSLEVKRRAFELFFTTKPRGLGTGLGLPLVHKVAVRAGGTVDIESDVSKGTSVVMTLPVAHRSKRASAGLQHGDSAVSIGDARAAALVRQIIGAAGFDVTAHAESDNVRLWVLDPDVVTVAEVRAWQARRRDRHVVLFGRPSRPALGASAEWRKVRAVTIEDRHDFESIRSALRHVIGEDEQNRLRRKP